MGSLWETYREQWVGLLESAEISDLVFFRQLVFRESYCALSMCFIQQTSYSFLQFPPQPRSEVSWKHPVMPEFFSPDISIIWPHDRRMIFLALLFYRKILLPALLCSLSELKPLSNEISAPVHYQCCGLLQAAMLHPECSRQERQYFHVPRNPGTDHLYLPYRRNSRCFLPLMKPRTWYRNPQ